MDTPNKEPVALIAKGTDRVVAWACATNGHVHAEEQRARDCCGPRFCEDCKAPAAEHRTVCASCASKRRAAAEAQRFEKARKVALADYQGAYLYCPRCSEYLETGEMAAHLVEEHGPNLDGPAYAYGCNLQRLALDAGEILNDALEQQEFYEDAIEAIPAKDSQALQAQLDAWCAGLTLEGCMATFDVAVPLDAEVKAWRRDLYGDDDEAEVGRG
jgi:hypothetical protein